MTALGGAPASVTVIGAVSPPGGDMTEPVTVHTERFVRCLWTLDRDLAYARHYPAISWAGSFSRDAGALAAGHAAAGDPAWPQRRARLAAVLAEADRLADLVDLIGIAALPARERISVLASRLVREGVLQQSALSERDAYCAEEAPDWLREVAAPEWFERYGKRIQQQALDQRRREQETDEWKAAYGTRAGVEGTISQAVRVTRTRTTPYRGLHKTHLGHVLIAAGLNLHRLDSWWTGAPIGSTHIIQFARLGLELAAEPHPIRQQSP